MIKILSMWLLNDPLLQKGMTQGAKQNGCMTRHTLVQTIFMMINDAPPLEKKQNFRARQRFISSSQINYLIYQEALESNQGRRNLMHKGAHLRTQILASVINCAPILEQLPPPPGVVDTSTFHCWT